MSCFPSARAHPPAVARARSRQQPTTYSPSNRRFRIAESEIHTLCNNRLLVDLLLERAHTPAVARARSRQQPTTYSPSNRRFRIAESEIHTLFNNRLLVDLLLEREGHSLAPPPRRIVPSAMDGTDSRQVDAEPPRTETASGTECPFPAAGYARAFCGGAGHGIRVVEQQRRRSASRHAQASRRLNPGDTGPSPTVVHRWQGAGRMKYEPRCSPHLHSFFLQLPSSTMSERPPCTEHDPARRRPTWGRPHPCSKTFGARVTDASPRNRLRSRPSERRHPLPHARDR